MRAMRNAFLVQALSLFMMAIVVSPGLAQDTPDYKKVIGDYIEATGGEMAHKKIESVVASGKVSIAAVGLEGEMSIKQAGNKGVLTMSIEGVGEETMGYDGETAWSISEMMGPEILEGERKDQLVMQMDLSPLMNIGKMFDEVSCTGVEEFNGEDCYVIEAVNEGQEPVFHFFSVESKLQTGSKMTAASPMGKMEIVSMLSDYRDVDGVKMPFKTEAELPQGMTLETIMESIETNAKIDDSTFDLPEEIQELKDDSEDR